MVYNIPKGDYPLVNCHITMENHHFSWENPRTNWPFSIAMSVITRGYNLHFPMAFLWFSYGFPMVFHGYMEA